MDNGEKIYMWLIIIAFIGFAIATGFAAMELVQLNEPLDSGIYKPNPFQ